MCVQAGQATMGDIGLDTLLELAAQGYLVLALNTDLILAMRRPSCNWWRCRAPIRLQLDDDRVAINPQLRATNDQP